MRFKVSAEYGFATQVFTAAGNVCYGAIQIMQAKRPGGIELRRILRNAVVLLFIGTLLFVTIKVCPLCSGTHAGDIQKQSSKGRQLQMPTVVLSLPVLVVTLAPPRPCAVVREQFYGVPRVVLPGTPYSNRPPPLSL